MGEGKQEEWLQTWPKGQEEWMEMEDRRREASSGVGKSGHMKKQE